MEFNQTDAARLEDSKSEEVNKQVDEYKSP